MEKFFASTKIKLKKIFDIPMKVKVHRIFPLSRRYLHPILIFLLVIVGPAVAFLYLGLQAVQRQQQAVASLTISNLRLSGEKLAGELERRALQLAEACFRDNELSRVRSALGNSDAPEAAREIRALLDPVRHRHPIARHFFVLQGNGVRFPLLESPLPQPFGGHLARENLGVRQQFEALFAKGEDEELLKQRPELALPAYQQCYKLPVSDPLKALALSRVARCHRKMKQIAEAEQAYHTILARFGDLYDPFHRPYAIIAALELNDSAITQEVSSPPPLFDLYNDLVQGRWELSAEQMDYFLVRLKEQVKEPPIPETEYLNHLKLARAIQDGFRHQGPLLPNQVYACAVTRGEASCQIFYTPIPSGSRQDHLLGFAVDLNWVENQLLPQCRSELGMAGSFGVTWKTMQSATLSESPSGVIVTFKALFPFWELSSVKTQQSIVLRQTLVFVGAILFVLSVLGLGVFLLIRDASREMQLARLRGDFVSGVSHELKTPLTLIRLYGEMLLYGQNLGEEERRNYYQIITGEGERLTHMIEKVLDFSRIDRGLKQYDLKEGDIAAVVGQTVEVYGQYLRRQGFSVETDLASELPPVRFDPEAISQAVLNLIDNAARYSGQSKFIGVRLSSRNNTVIFEVEDHGPSITASERPKIFGQFYRGPGSAGKGGYGLGLYLVKHIMDAHGGSIELESEVERGSRFRLIFPCIKS